MKRTRSGHVYGIAVPPAAKRARQCVHFPFLELLPEMQGEVLGHVTELAERAALARTCKQMHQWLSPILPKLPEEWKYMWDTLKELAPPEDVRAGHAAILELITLGLPTWPGAFRSGRAVYEHDEPLPGAIHGDPPRMVWEWTDCSGEGDVAIVWLFYYPRSCFWMLWGAGPAGSTFDSYFYKSLATANTARWRDILARPRPRTGPFQRGHFHRD